MSSSVGGTTPVRSSDCQPRACSPADNQTTCLAGPPTFRRAMRRNTRMGISDILAEPDCHPIGRLRAEADVLQTRRSHHLRDLGPGEALFEHCAETIAAIGSHHIKGSMTIKR